jgi:hypothetical protein
VGKKVFIPKSGQKRHAVQSRTAALALTRPSPGPHPLLGVGFSLYEIIYTHLAFGFLSGQVELVKKAI